MDHEEIESLSFEDSYNLLDELIQKLETGNMSIDESVALYEEGMKLAAHCERQLDDAEIKVTQLLSAAASKLEQHNPRDE